MLNLLPPDWLLSGSNNLCKQIYTILVEDSCMKYKDVFLL